MLASPAQVVAAYLSTLSGFLTGWQLKVGNEPDSPDNVVTVFDTGAFPDDRLMSGEVITHPTVQVRVRATDYTSGWRKGRVVEEAMKVVRNTVVSVGTPPETVVMKAATRYISLVPLGQDPNQNRRQLFVVNFKLTFTSTPTGGPAMALSVSTSRKTTIDGRAYESNSGTIVAEVAVKFDKTVAAAQAGTLTTRTSTSVGTLTMTSGSHGIVTGDRLDIYWTGGSRIGVTVGTVAGTSVPFTLGEGDDLPVATTAVTAMVPGEEVFTVEGDDIAAMGVMTTATKATVVFADASDATLATAEVGTNDSFAWTTSDGLTNPLAGASVAKVFVSHGDSSGSKIVRGVAAYN